MKIKPPPVDECLACRCTPEVAGSMAPDAPLAFLFAMEDIRLFGMAAVLKALCPAHRHTFDVISKKDDDTFDTSGKSN